MPDSNLPDKRCRAARLLQDVLEERLAPQVAINRWPETDEPGDASLDAAHQALWHFEADETQQQTELFYMDAQLELLRQMSRLLAEGRDLPAYMLQAYPARHRVRFFYPLSPWAEYTTILARIGRRFQALWRQALRLNPLLSGRDKPKSPLASARELSAIFGVDRN